MPTQSPAWELADIFREHGNTYRSTQPLPLAHLKVMHAITTCRTPHLGGHIERCESCGYERAVYHSCRNRHCPKCQTLTKARWLQARMADLLPVKYFHTVFTLPHALNPLMLCNKEVMLAVLFKAVSQTLLAFGRNHLGGRLGFIAVLHTWDQVLMDHFHLHCVVPAGALAHDGSRWTPSRSTGYLFPVRALSRVFRGKFIALLEEERCSGTLIFPGRTVALGTPQGFARLIGVLRSQPWVVFSKQPFAGPEQVLDYLGRYTHRVAISNHRILALDGNRVSFSYQDRRDDTRKVMTLDANEFIRRFLLHVLPQGFMRIRSFGFLANRTKKQSLARIRALLAHIPQPKPGVKTPRALMLELTGIDIERCPCCGAGSLRVIVEFQPCHPGKGESLPPSAVLNSS
jgi:hypothetical protein